MIDWINIILRVQGMSAIESQTPDGNSSFATTTTPNPDLVPVPMSSPVTANNRTSTPTPKGDVDDDSPSVDEETDRHLHTTSTWIDEIRGVNYKLKGELSKYFKLE
eukprot:TRINITY_DN1276_c0_g1_i1.p1 TRINITY_DN1276_c0_g1~~TRINITY_DN1276_c0_g1_i1.p1  ORF type:complete len:106 (+),score=25.59 TRINITY_DN1276_c0_g1_i1:680-997(+)